MIDVDLPGIIHRAAETIRARCNCQWRVLIVLGSGLGGLADEVVSPVRIPYADIPGFASSTVQGHVGSLLIGDLYGIPVGIMQGRSHFYEGYPLWQITLPVRVARALGADTLIVSNAAGGINRNFRVADLMLITDHINLLGMAGHNPLVGPNVDDLGPRFPDMSEAYDPGLRACALRVAGETGIDLKQGVYAGLSGPTFETPAEVRFLRTMGADAVGMSTVNEVVVARHGGMRVLGFSVITNVARLSADEGEPPSHEEVLQAGPVCAPRLLTVVKGVLKEL